MAQNGAHYPLQAAPFRQCLERDVFLSVHTWNDQPRVDLRQCTDGYPTQKGCILTASRWAILMDHLEELETKMSEVQEGNPEINFKIHLGGNVFAAVTSPYPIVDIRLRFMNDGTLLHTRRGVTLRFPGLMQLKECIPRVYEAIPRTTPCYLVHKEADDEMACVTCKECSPNTYML